MNYEIAGIPTHYNGINFRSRLEARWAAFFDLLKWDWTYEPVDFNGWIPDFVIHGHMSVYVEVKPVTEFPSDVAEKIDASGCPNEVLIVGALGPMWDPGCEWVAKLGWLREFYPNDSDVTGDKKFDFWWEHAPMGRWIGSEGERFLSRHNQIGFCHEIGCWTDRITGNYDGGCFGQGELTKQEILSLWRQACNRTQWLHKK